jgi:hypothetical protein
LQEGQCSLNLLVEGNGTMDSGASNGQQLSATFLDKDQPFGRKRFGRLRRDRGNDLVISLAEDQPIGMLKQVKILGQIIGPIILAISNSSEFH